MTAYEALQGLKKFLEEKVTPGLKLQKELSDPVEYVSPYVSLITIPHKNFMPLNFAVPNILVGIVTGEDDSEEHTLNIRITCATYGGDVRFEEENNIPDEKGYLDLLNMLERIKHALIDEAIIEGAGVVNKPVQYGIYSEEITYPYWYGYLQFTMQIPVTQRQFNDYL